MHGTNTKGTRKTKVVIEHRGFIVYKTYLFRDKDPNIDKLRTIVQQSGLSRQEIHELSGVAVGTMKGWFDGKTLRPRFCGMQAVGRACGKTLDWVDYDPKKHGK
jgi:hypothetical protein